MVSRHVKRGNLTVSVGERLVGRFGDGSGPPVRVRLTRGAAFAVALHPWLRAGEAYMDGDLVIEEGSVYDLLELFGRNFADDPERDNPGPWRRLGWAVNRALTSLNGRSAARRNVSHHYDLSVDFYRLFLDRDLQYSCAYVDDPAGTLESWQAAKKAHIAAKLDLRPGQRVLDIGCGWGGLALTLAEEWGVEVLGITLSREQLATARARAAERGLVGRARFELCDYRDVRGPFDRIVSVGMFEHVGAPNYQAYFDAVARLLTDDGVALVHSIGRRGQPGMTNPWIAKHIFPGGYIPSLSQVTPCIERAGLWASDIEVLRLHYAETIRAWSDRFRAARDQAQAMYDERFCRMWEFYLAVSEIAFRYDGHMVFQTQLAKSVDALPITRGYMAAAEDAWAARTSPYGPKLVRTGTGAAE